MFSQIEVDRFYERSFSSLSRENCQAAKLILKEIEFAEIENCVSHVDLRKYEKCVSMREFFVSMNEGRSECFNKVETRSNEGEWKHIYFPSRT